MLRFKDPFTEMDQMIDQLNGRWRSGVMPMDACERDGSYVLRFDLPGVDADQVDVTVENRELTVTATRTSEGNERVTWLVRERPTGTHSRQVLLGDRVDTSGVAATYDDGVLTVTIPLSEQATPRKVSVGLGGKQHQAIEDGDT